MGALEDPAMGVAAPRGADFREPLPGDAAVSRGDRRPSRTNTFSDIALTTPRFHLPRNATTRAGQFCHGWFFNGSAEKSGAARTLCVREREMISGRMNVLEQNFLKNVLPIWVAARLVG